MQSKQMIRIAMRLTEAIIEILKEEMDGKDKVTNAKKQKQSNRIRKAGRQNSFAITKRNIDKKIQSQVNLRLYREPVGSLQLKNLITKKNLESRFVIENLLAYVN